LPHLDVKEDEMTSNRLMFSSALITLAAASAFSAWPAAAQSGSQSAGSVRAACAADVRALCAGVLSGGGRIKACIKEKREQLSKGCKDALMDALATHQ
jgi:hypothetical protein